MDTIENKDDQYDSAASSDDDEAAESQYDQHEDEGDGAQQEELVHPETQATARPTFEIEPPNPDGSSTTLEMDAHTGWTDEEEEIEIKKPQNKPRKRSSSSSEEMMMSSKTRFRGSKSRLGTVMNSSDDFLTENSPVAKV